MVVERFLIGQAAELRIQTISGYFLKAASRTVAGGVGAAFGATIENVLKTVIRL